MVFVMTAVCLPTAKVLPLLYNAPDSDFSRTDWRSALAHNSLAARFCQQQAGLSPILTLHSKCHLSHRHTSRADSSPAPRRIDSLCTPQQDLRSGDVKFLTPEVSASFLRGNASPHIRKRPWNCLHENNVGRCQASLRTEYAEGVSAEEGPAPELGKEGEVATTEDERKESKCDVHILRDMSPPSKAIAPPQDV